MQLPGANEETWEKITTSKFGYTGFNLSRSSANIKRVKERVAELRKLAAGETKEIIIKGVRLVENVEANRVQLFFPERVSKEVYKDLRRSGFVWCPSEGAFQRQLKSYAVRIAKDFLQKL